MMHYKVELHFKSWVVFCNPYILLTLFPYMRWPEKTADICDAITTSFPSKWRLRNERRMNSILMTSDHPDLGGTYDWLKICFIQSELLPTGERWCIIGMDFLRFLRSSSGGVKKCWPFSQATWPEDKDNSVQKHSLSFCFPFQATFFLPKLKVGLSRDAWYKLLPLAQTKEQKTWVKSTGGGGGGGSI